MDCSLCGADFDHDAEGGWLGYFGILLMAFCPYCWGSLRDMVEDLMDCKHGVNCPVCDEERF